MGVAALTRIHSQAMVVSVENPQVQIVISPKWRVIFHGVGEALVVVGCLQSDESGSQLPLTG